MAELKTDYGGQVPKTTDENSETDELIQSAYRMIESVRMTRDRILCSSQPATPNNNSIQTPNNRTSPFRPQMDIQRTTNLGSCPQRLHSVNTLSFGSRSQNNGVLSTTAEYNRQDMNSAFLLDETLDTVSTNSSPNSESHSVHEVINLSDVAVPESSNAQGQNPTIISQMPVHIVDEEDDVIIVSSNMADIVDLCSPLHQVSNQRRRRIPSYHQDRNRSNLTSRRCARLNSPIGSAQLSTDIVPQISTTYIQQPQQQDQFLTTPMATVDDSAVDKNISSTNSSNERSILMCPVCMESSVKRKPTSTKCGHVFCARCINQALRLTHKCPMCNTKLNNRMLFRIYP